MLLKSGGTPPHSKALRAKSVEEASPSVVRYSVKAAVQPSSRSGVAGKLTRIISVHSCGFVVLQATLAWKRNWNYQRT